MRTLRVVACLLVLAGARSSHALPIRRLFEPTDLEVEDPGVAEVDLQLGPIRGPNAWRLVVPDFEVDLGLTREVELEVDGAVAVEDRSGDFDHLSPDNLWVSAKVGLGDVVFDEGHGDDDLRLAYGFQVGPKLPTAREAQGIGIEGLGLVGVHWRRTLVVLNLGGLMDPSAGRAGRPAGFEGGFDLDQILDDGGMWSLTGELGGVLFTSDDGDQLTATAGFTYHATPMLDLSIVGLVGLTRGSDRGGVLLGISPKFRLW
jgi:hypothetical protein